MATKKFKFHYGYVVLLATVIMNIYYACSYSVVSQFKMCIRDSSCADAEHPSGDRYQEHQPGKQIEDNSRKMCIRDRYLLQSATMEIAFWIFFSLVSVY